MCLTRGDGRSRVYHRRNERDTEACTTERDQFGGGVPVMVWGGVSQHHRTELVVIAGNFNTELQGRHPPPSCGTLPAGSSWHDSATSHTARDFLHEEMQLYLMQLVATPDTQLLLILPPLCSGTHYSISVKSHVCCGILCSYKYLHVKFAENEHS